ncbi:AzlD family protein [Gallibacterium salpingitidis]|uniref:Membrane protein n=1 Tax=Gallibacterium salpingitidis TaxID=505341 RepID=A0A1A7NZV9_9PAST|nr:AzlD family protein [Gallibacterium salpingitidis]OBW95026.1 membrane protein [Gallibacterium salpingitidis]WKS99895.1 AzlD family protein [Gallibacterium salpingitidis]
MSWEVLTIFAMAAVTYSTRLLGFFLLQKTQLSPMAKNLLAQVPPCVLIAVIAPEFTSSNPADWIGLLATFLAATRFSVLPTVVIGIIVTALARHFIG